MTVQKKLRILRLMKLRNKKELSETILALKKLKNKILEIDALIDRLSEQSKHYTVTNGSSDVNNLHSKVIMSQKIMFETEKLKTELEKVMVDENFLKRKVERCDAINKKIDQKIGMEKSMVNS
ncbi:MAG: hypothetical protein ACPF9Z_07630 [Paracoccaceae bacterium]